MLTRLELYQIATALIIRHKQPNEQVKRIGVKGQKLVFQLATETLEVAVKRELGKLRFQFPNYIAEISEQELLGRPN